MGFAATASLVLGAASTATNAYGAYQAGKSAKNQAALNQAQSEISAQLSTYNANQIENYAGINIGLTKSVAGLNNQITSAIAGANIGIINATTDFNVGVIGATTNFNVDSAAGAGKIIEAQGDMEANAHTFNAGIAEAQAQDVLGQGNQAETQSRTAYAELKGKQRASLAANGVALDEGSALRIQSDTDYASDTDASIIRANALKAALGYRAQSVNEMTEASMASLNAKGLALDKYAEGVSAKINGITDEANAKISGSVKALDTGMTASFNILNNTISSDVQAINIQQQADMQAWDAKAAAQGYSAQANAYGLQASSINPFMMGATSLLAGAASVSDQYARYQKAGATSKKGP